MVRPSDAAHVEVKQWLHTAGIARSACIEDWSNYICKKVSISSVEHLLNVTINTYQHKILGNKTVLMTEDPLVSPTSVHFVSGLDLYDPMVKPRHSSSWSSKKKSLPKTFMRERDFQAQGFGSGSAASLPSESTGAPIILALPLSLSMNGIKLSTLDASYSSERQNGQGTVLVGFYCSSGDLTNYNLLNNQWCQTVNNAPSSVTITVMQGSSVFSSQVFNLPPSGSSSSGVSCNSAQSWYQSMFLPEYQNMVFCLLPAGSDSSYVQSWERYSFTAQATFVSNEQSGVGGYVGVDGTAIDVINNQIVYSSNIKSKYSLPDGCEMSTSGGTTSQGILALAVETTTFFSSQNFQSTDWPLFQSVNNISCNPSLTLSFVSPAEGSSVNDADLGETTLDLEMIMATSPQTSTVLWYSSGWLDWITTILSPSTSINPLAGNTPSVWSSSYSAPESSYQPQHMDAINTGLKMLAGSGVSVFTSAGDSGAGDSEGNVGPHFPQSSPYITTVGATAFYASSSGGQLSEIVCSSADSNGITSGGGFSNVLGQPTYQQSAVSAYTNTYGSSFSSQVNQSNRAYPDIAAVGASIYTEQSGKSSITGGTSASSPIVAGIFSLINQERLNNNMAVMGFVNPFLYQTEAITPSAFNDVTQGNNCVGRQNYSPYLPIGNLNFPFVDTPSWPLGQCFTAATGWDPVTGLGSVNYDALRQAALSWTPPTSPAPSAPSSGILPIIIGASAGGVVLIGLAVYGIYKCKGVMSGTLYDGSGVTADVLLEGQQAAGDLHQVNEIQ